MLPHFIIIGAMNAGTTSLYHYLKTHPDIISSSPKEPSFFVQDRFRKGLEWYKSIFKGAGRFAFEASANYSKRHLFPGVPKRMFKVVSEIKLIYLLRDPIERAKSHYMWGCAHGLEDREFSSVIKDHNCNLIKTGQYYY